MGWDAHFLETLCRIVLALAGIMVFCAEFAQADEKISIDGEDTAISTALLVFLGPFYLLFIRYPWYALSGLLVLEAIAFPISEDVATGSVLIYIIPFSIALLRLVFLSLTFFGPNKHKFLAGKQQFELKGEKGILLKEVSPTLTGIMRMENPIFKNDEVECIADEYINAGTIVKVLEVDCGLLKVAPLSTPT